jgi:hypothetical protein
LDGLIPKWSGNLFFTEREYKSILKKLKILTCSYLFHHLLYANFLLTNFFSLVSVSFKPFQIKFGVQILQVYTKAFFLSFSILSVHKLCWKLQDRMWKAWALGVDYSLIVFQLMKEILRKREMFHLEVKRWGRYEKRCEPAKLVRRKLWHEMWTFSIHRTINKIAEVNFHFLTIILCRNILIDK